MRLYQQLVLFMLAATVLPLAGLGFSLLASTEAEVARRIRTEQEALARAAATEVSRELMQAVESIGRSAELLDWEALAPEERRGALTLLYEQSPLVGLVLQVDAQGRPLSAPVGRQEPGTHPVFRPEALPTLLSAVPVAALARGHKGQVALSAAYASGREAAMALAVKLAAGEAAPFAVAQLHLAALSAPLSRAAGEGRTADLVDAEGRIWASAVAARAPGQLEAAPLAHLRGQQAQGVLVSAAPVPGGAGLYVAVAAQEAAAFAPVRALRRTVLLSVGGGLAVLLAMGALFTRRLNRRLAVLARGAEALGQGALSTRLPLEGRDELTEVAGAFNRMGSELEAARSRLERFNDELRQRVEEATRELKAAQAQLVETQKLAAVGQLGAGVAHEINNPLAGILGHTQILLMEKPPADPDVDVLRRIEQAAMRVKDITANLLRFSQQREQALLHPMDANLVVRDVLSLSENQLKGEGTVLEVALAPEPQAIEGDSGHLAQVLLALVQNARTAMARTPLKRLSLTTRTEGEEVLLSVADTGKGIAPEHLPRIFEPFFTTKDVWSNVGLGLSVAYRVVQEHGGRITVATEPGRGSTFTVHLPRLR